MIERRYRGPEHSGNGGYTAGRLAAFVDGAAEVTLRVPPPLDRPLRVERRDGVVALLDGDTLVAEARPTTLELEPPVAVSFEEALEASKRYPGFEEHVFPGCFTCGPARDPGDGLRIFPGPLNGVVAAPWVASEVAPEIVWAAIDCPGAFGVGYTGRGETVLGRMAAEILRLPREGERCVAMGWPLGEDGRKLFAGTALVGEDEELLARARQTWIAPRA